MNDKRASMPRNREAFEERYVRDFGSRNRIDPTASGIEDYVVTFTSADWARCKDTGPGAVRVEVWSAEAAIDFDRMLRIVNDCAPACVGFSVCPPTFWKRAQLRATFVGGWLLMKAHVWIFDRLGGTWV